MKEIITSRQNPRIKEVMALADKKARKKSGLFRFDGIKLFCECLGRAEISSAFVREPMGSALSEVLADAISRDFLTQEQIIYVSEGVFDKLSEENAPEGIITVCKNPKGLHGIYGTEGVAIGERLLLAESIRDPGNLGTVIRSCASLGIDTLIISADCAELYNPRTVRSAMGALLRQRILIAEELSEVIGELRLSGRCVYATALHTDALRIGKMPIRRGDCFVIGNEGHGLSQKIIDACDGCAVIPMTEGSESLNAAAAAAICIWETVRAEEDI